MDWITRDNTAICPLSAFSTPGWSRRRSPDDQPQHRHLSQQQPKKKLPQVTSLFLAYHTPLSASTYPAPGLSPPSASQLPLTRRSVAQWPSSCLITRCIVIVAYL